MESIKLIINGESKEVNVVRYFELNGNKYLIYSLNEIDMQGYIKLYIIKVEMDNATGTDNALSIVDEQEWTNLKDEIKKIVRDNHVGTLNVDDLNYKKIEGLIVNDNKVFKLPEKLLSDLSSNKKTFAEEPKEEVSLDEPSIPTPTFDINPAPIASVDETPDSSDENISSSVQEENYEELYNQEKARNEELNQKISALEAKLENIKNLLD